MENEREKWEKVRIKKETEEDLERLRLISSLYATNLIGKVELRVMIQEINWLSLVAVTVDFLYQYQKKIKDCQKRISQKALIKATKEMDRLTLIRLIMKIFEDRKEKYWEEEAKKIKKIQHIEAKTNVSFFCLKF